MSDTALHFDEEHTGEPGTICGEDDYDRECNDCPACGATQHSTESYMGSLGGVHHHRCRHCGADFSVAA